MKIYFAGGGGPAGDVRNSEMLQKEVFRKTLLSYFYYTDKDDEFYFHKKNKIMLDSGAFSAHNSGVEIPLQDYIDFLKKHNHIDIYYNLDVIGNAEETWKNQKIMEDNGLAPIPVYHVGEDKKYLKKCFEYPYFALGGMVGRPRPVLRSWLDRVFEMAPYESDGTISNKVHGLGMTSWDYMCRYPWFSCDSSSWIMVCVNGGIYLPKFTSNGFDFTEPPQIKHVTRTGENISQVQEYLSSFGLSIGKSVFEKKSSNYELKEKERKVSLTKNTMVIEKIIEEGVSNNRAQRLIANAYFTNQFVKQIPNWPTTFDFRRKRFF